MTTTIGTFLKVPVDVDKVGKRWTAVVGRRRTYGSTRTEALADLADVVIAVMRDAPLPTEVEEAAAAESRRAARANKLDPGLEHVARAAGVDRNPGESDADLAQRAGLAVATMRGDAEQGRALVASLLSTTAQEGGVEAAALARLLGPRYDAVRTRAAALRVLAGDAMGGRWSGTLADLMTGETDDPARAVADAVEALADPEAHLISMGGPDLHGDLATAVLEANDATTKAAYARGVQTCAEAWQKYAKKLRAKRDACSFAEDDEGDRGQEIEALCSALDEDEEPNVSEEDPS